MNPYMAYDAVNTKITTKKGNIINNIDWEKLLEFSTAEEVKNYLINNIEFNKILEDVKNTDINRDSLEAVLGKFKTLEIEELLHYFSGPYKDFIKTMLLESEIADLSLIIRKIVRQESLNGIENRFVHSKSYSSIQYNKLIESKNIEQFTENLKGTPYYSELKNLSKEDAIKREFHIEMKLYMILYNSIISKAENLEKDDMVIAKDIVGNKIDLLNIQWIYRARHYYKITPNEILIYSLSDGKKITYSKLKQLSYSKTEKEFNDLIKIYFKNDLFGKMKETYYSEAMYSYMYHFLKKNINNGIGSIISYIYLLDIIINDLTTITEGIKYNMPKDKLKEMLDYRIK